MALIECPDCGRKVSDRAETCPDCSSPVRAIVAERAEQERLAANVKSRKTLEREIDCPKCGGRGWHPFEGELVQWCIPCEATGHVILCGADDGYYAVAHYAVARFVAGELVAGKSGVVFHLGPNDPGEPSFPAHKRIPVQPDEIPW